MSAFDGELTGDYPWPDRPWVRALMVMNLEGATVGPDGRSGSISGPADLAVLIAVRRFSDAVIIGAQTMRAESYKPMRSPVAEERLQQGLREAPRLVVVSASLDLPWFEPVFSQSTLPPLIVTCEASSADQRSLVPSACELLVAPGQRVDPRWLVESLVERGLRRLVCEGGPALLAGFAGAGCVDEWAVTISGAVGAATYVPVATRSADQFVFTRFVRSTSERTPAS